METKRCLQVLAILFLTVGMAVSGQSTDYSKVAFVGKVVEVRLMEKGGFRVDTISAAVNPGELPNMSMGMKPTIYSVICTVEKLYYSHYLKDTIEFLIYTEKAEPNLSYFKYVFCLLKQNEAGNYETFRQYYDAYQTNKGEWVAGFYSGWMLDSEYFLENYKKIGVKKQHYMDLKLFKTRGVNMRGVSEYYKIKRDRAIPKVGVPVDGLMKHLLVKKVISTEGQSMWILF